MTSLIRKLSIARDFSKFPAGRYTEDGPESGQVFRETVLVPALENGGQVCVDLDGTEGYGSSFLEEAFGGLIRKHGFQRSDLGQRLTFVSAEDPSLVIEISQYLDDAVDDLVTAVSATDLQIEMADKFVQGLGLGAFLGVLATEVLRQVLGRFFRRGAEKGEVTRKLLRDDIDSLSKLIDPLFTSAQDYYGKPSHQGKRAAAKLKSDLKVFAAAWNTLHQRLVELEMPSIELGPLVSFRNALTGSLEETRPNALDIDDVVVTKIFNATAKVRDALSKARYQAT